METKNTFSLLFYLKKTRINKKGESPIYMRITVNGKQIALSLNRGISISLWNTDAGLASGNTKQAKLINSYINTVQASIYEHFKNLRQNQSVVTAIALKNAFLGIEEKGKGVIEVFKKHNKDANELIGIDFSKGTVQRYETSLMHTQNFIKLKYGLDDYYLTDINHQFITDYEMYFKTVRNCGHNTTMKYIKNFKKIIRIALANAWIKQDPFANYKMKLKKIDRDYLTDEELNVLMSKKFKIERLEQVRDTFLFSCFTGLAHSDLKLLTPEHISIGDDGNNWVKIKRKKTNGQSNIPVLPVTEALIEKYKTNPTCILNNVLLPVLSNQKMNAYLKEIADLCGIEKNLSSHIARHTFATTVTLNNDVPIETVSKMLGHSSISMTKTYARLLDKKVGRDMQHLNDKYNLTI